LVLDIVSMRASDAMLDVDAFISNGYVKIEQPASRTVADAARALLWRQLGLSADEHRGRTPRFMAQSPIVLTSPLTPASSSPLACVFAA
jgi:hypothetical protein